MGNLMERLIMAGLAAGIIMAGSVACSKSDVQEEKGKEYIVTEYGSSGFPEEIPYNGGSYSLFLNTDIQTRSSSPEFIPWLYRLTEGGTVHEPVPVTEKTEETVIEVSPNYSISERDIMVEISYSSDSPEWETVTVTTQASAFMQIGDFFWAKGNITVNDGRFVLTDRMSDTGLLFRNGSIYGIPVSENGQYGGTAYNPEPVSIALDEIPYGLEDTDPCSLVGDEFRTPSYAELMSLYSYEDYTSGHELDGIRGMGYTGYSYFMPFGGYLSAETGVFAGLSEYGGFWGLGSNYHSDPVIYIMNADYSMVNFDLVGANLAMVRCVRDIRLPSYLSHSAEGIQGNSGFSLTVCTDPGEFHEYTVSVESNDGEYMEEMLSPGHSEAVFNIPENADTEERTWKIYVNQIYTGKSIVQDGLSDYAIYLSHSPASAGYEAFELRVRYMSDKVSFPVEIKGSDGFSDMVYGTSSGSEVVFQIPENTGDERTLSIWIDGTDTGKSVVQEGSPASSRLSVIWSSGYLTVKDGAFTFAGSDEKGLYFKWKSAAGIDLGQDVTSSSRYGGTVFTPEETSIPDYADVPYGNSDPCAMISPAGTWRMPSPELLEELAGAVSEGAEGGKECYDGEQRIRFVPSGMLNKDGSKVMLPSSSILIWTDAVSGEDPSKRQYFMWSMSGSSGKLSKNDPNVGMMVRCVRDR